MVDSVSWQIRNGEAELMSSSGFIQVTFQGFKKLGALFIVSLFPYIINVAFC